MSVLIGASTYLILIVTKAKRVYAFSLKQIDRISSCGASAGAWLACPAFSRVTPGRWPPPPTTQRHQLYLSKSLSIYLSQLEIVFVQIVMYIFCSLFLSQVALGRWPPIPRTQRPHAEEACLFKHKYVLSYFCEFFACGRNLTIIATLLVDHAKTF